MLKFFFKFTLSFAVSFLILNVPVGKKEKLFDLISEHFEVDYEGMYDGAKKGLSKGKDKGLEFSKDLLDKVQKSGAIQSNLESEKKKVSLTPTVQVELHKYSNDDEEAIDKILE